MKFYGRLFICFLLLYSCKNEKGEPTSIDYKGFNEKNIFLIGFNKKLELIDTLGGLSFKIPKKIDTFYQWHNTSDCLPCGWLEYRFADRKYSQFAESGFFWTTIPDSVYQITISHNPVKEFNDSLTLRLLTENDSNNNRFNRENNLGFSGIDTVRYLKREFRIINKRPFLIFIFISPVGYVTQKETLFVTAVTNLRNRRLFITGECGAKDTSGFINNIYKTMLSVKIQEK